MARVCDHRLYHCPPRPPRAFLFSIASRTTYVGECEGAAAAGELSVSSECSYIRWCPTVLGEQEK